ncbi:hypothetical protein I5Q34_03640 [Streptomyces sp. AV19]|nr:hypothetical protein [Streptomyces sp. AV19]
MGELKPVDDDLPPAAAVLAQALRDLFTGLCVSTRRYAARRAYDSSTVSRYLSGRRVPPWEFVLNLLHDVGETRGSVPTAETIDRLRTLHTAALESGGSPAHRVQLLERELAAADGEARHAATRERWLEDTLQDREHRIRDLEMRNRELEARLREEIRDLKEELVRVQALHQQAEDRCEQLERQLAEAEERAPLPAGFRPEADVHNNVAAGQQFLSSVMVYTDSWQVDEEFVESVSVQLYAMDHRYLGNGLLFDAETVITPGPVPEALWTRSETERTVKVHVGGRKVPATSLETRASPPLVVLRLEKPLPFPGRPLSFDRRLMPGRQLLVSAYTTNGPYSCLLDVKGRTGNWLRVTGELPDGLIGAPAFSGAGALTGLLLSCGRDGQRGLLLPVGSLRALTTVKLPDEL